MFTVCVLYVHFVTCHTDVRCVCCTYSSPVWVVCATHNDIEGAPASPDEGWRTPLADRSILRSPFRTSQGSPVDRNDQGCLVAEKGMTSFDFI